MALICSLLPVTRGFQPVDGDTVVERTRYLAGLTTVVSVAHNFWIEADGIYKPLRAGNDSLTRFSVLTWQFPVLAKYSLAKRTFTWRPFAEGGPSFRLAGNLNGYNPSHYGVTVGGGIETYVRGVRLSPALRYTRWAKDASPFRIPSGVQYDYARTNANAVELVCVARRRALFRRWQGFTGQSAVLDGDGRSLSLPSIRTTTARTCGP